MQRFRQDELMDILSQAGPRGKELMTAVSKRQSVELHVHINGPIVIGVDMAETISNLILSTRQNTTPVP